MGATNLFNKFYWEKLGAASSVTGGVVNAASGRVGTPGLPRVVRDPAQELLI